jgi:general secretion pathway protein D
MGLMIVHPARSARFWTLLCVLSVLLLPPGIVATQELPLEEIEFVNKPIRDILLSMASVAGVSVLPDETVDGVASYFFRGVTFEEALDAFLPPHGVFWWKEGDIYYASRIRSSYDPETDRLTIRGDDVGLEDVLRRIGEESDRTVLYDQLPSGTISINASGLAPERVLAIAIRRFADLELSTEEDFFYVRRIPDQPVPSTRAPETQIRVEDGRYSIEVDRGRYVELVDELFRQADLEYLMLRRGDATLENIRFENRSFDEMLRLLSDLGGADFRVVDGVYYITELRPGIVENRIDRSVEIQLNYLAASSVPRLLPSSMSNSGELKVDEVNNVVTLFGSDREIVPVAEFIRRLDRPVRDRTYRRFNLSYVSPDDAIRLLPPELEYSPTIIPPDAGAFLMLLNDAQDHAVRRFVEMLDRDPAGELIRLKFIRADDLLTNLPPSVTDREVLSSGTQNAVFFRGSAEKRQRFLQDLSEIDVPSQQVRYELLIVQNQETDSYSFGFSAGSSLAGEGDETSYAGTIGNLLDVNFDIVSTFGYVFALRLNADIGESRARVLADTTLNGISGQELQFRNTSTFRYRESEIDPDTGAQRYTGITREIVSGLIVSLNGWVSGDGMVTMDVEATISRRGADTSSSSGDPPPTSEKIVSTQVRTRSGEPVILGGLLQQESSRVEQRAPLFSRIPLIGWLFKSRDYSAEDTEFNIYIVPHVEYTDYGTFDDGERIRNYYRELIQ